MFTATSDGRSEPEIFQKFPTTRSIIIARRYSVSLTMLAPPRKLSATQFLSPASPTHDELIVEQSMFKVNYGARTGWSELLTDI